jgi:predicted O-methyltransferase YrrM
MKILNPGITEYIEGILPARRSPFDRMEAYAKENSFPIIGPLVGTMLQQYVLTTGAKQIFELGSGYGYSALWMAEVLPPDGRIYLTDRKQENKRMADGFFEEAGLADKMEFHVGDALEIFEKFEGPFDIVLNDIDKQGYTESIEPVKKRLKKGGLFITDNILWSGRILDTERDQTTEAIVEFTRKLYADTDFLTSIVPVRDGITVAVKLN